MELHILNGNLPYFTAKAIVNQCIFEWPFSYHFQFGRFLELRHFIDEASNSDDSLKVTPTKWKTIEVIRDILHEPYMLTMALQREDYTLSDFYGDWLRTKRNLIKMGHSLADSIVLNMEKRENRIMNSNLMLAAVFLDPRYNMLLSKDQKDIAVAHLCQLWCRIQEINPTNTNSTNNSQENDEFAEFLGQASNEPQNTSIADRLPLFLHRPQINYKTNILEYWNRIKPEEPELFKLQTVLFSVAVTQVDVERSFSSLKFVFNNYRSKLNTEMLSQILILRSNYDLFTKTSDINFDENPI